MGAAGLNELLLVSLSFALLGVPGLLLFRLTRAMLSLVCARPPICRRSMRFCVFRFGAVHQANWWGQRAAWPDGSIGHTRKATARHLQQTGEPVHTAAAADP
jgi:hypothetical protein